MEGFASVMETVASLLLENQSLKHEIISLKSSGAFAQVEKDEQQTYQDTQDRFRTVFENSRLGNKIISPSLQILQVNMAMVHLLGCETKAEILGKKIIDFSPADFHKDWQFLQEKLWQHTSPSFSLETCLRRKDGLTVWCQVTSILFPDHDQTLGYTIIEDITEKRELRAQREQFISVASHELKTPITSLRATIQLINRMMIDDGHVPDKIIKLAQNIERYSLKLNHLVCDLLHSTVIENGQLNLNKNRFKVSDLIDGCCGHIRLEGKYKLTFSGDHELEAYADEQKIDQVLVNLVNNAVKYAPNSYEITIAVNEVADGVKVSVTDTGEGIPADSLPKLFDRYYRVNQSDKQSGIGLGLYICSEIIRRHGGEIGVESELGVGTTFWFTIPQVSVNN